MKKALSWFLFLALSLGLCACGAGSAVPGAVSPSVTAGGVLPTPGPTAVPEEPGAGRLAVHISGEAREYTSGGTALTLTVQTPQVTVTGREAAAAAINAALSGLPAADAAGYEAADRLCLVERGDTAVLSLAVGCGGWSGGRCATRVWTGVTYDTRTGAALSLSALAEDEAALRALCGQWLSENGAGEAAAGLVADGNWYLSGEGLAFCIPGSGDAGAGAQPEAVTVPYAVLTGALRDAWMPPEQEPVTGTLRADYTTADGMADKTVLDEVTTPNGLESVLLWADGPVRAVRVSSVTSADGVAFTETSLLWYGSRLEAGEAVRLNTTVPEGVPGLQVSWETDLGASQALLAWDGRSGGVALVSPSEMAAGTAEPTAGSYASVTEAGLCGSWSNTDPAGEIQSLTLQAGLCNVWSTARGLSGEGCAWELVSRDAENACPALTIHARGGDLILAVDALDASSFHCADTGETFARVEAFG